MKTFLLLVQTTRIHKTLLFFFVLAAVFGNVHAQIAKDNCKFLGNVISSAVPTDFNQYWNQVTPENSGKWASVEATRDVMNWDELDIAYAYAKSKNYPFKQHTLVWGQQQPDWIAALPLAEQKEEVEEWIQLFGERYPETDFIDVVNEPLHAVPGYAAALGGTGTTGWDWVIWAFEKAREYCPNAKLILNDYNIISNNTATTQYLEIINLLKERGLIDVIGEQGHFLETTPIATIKANLDKLYQTELPIQISEYDINLSNDTDQKKKFEEQFPVLWAHPGVKGITLWGYKQGQIWRTDAYLVRSSGAERPALTWLKSYVAGTTGENFCVVTGVDGENASGIEVYPNPSVDGKFIVKSIVDSQVEIFDMKGKSIHGFNVSSAASSSVDMGIKPGVYLMRTSTQFGRGVQKIVVR